MKWRTDRFIALYQQLDRASKRRLPNLGVEIKYSQYLDVLRPIFEAVVSNRKKEQLPFIWGTGKSEVTDKLGLALALSTFNEQLIDIPVPRKRFTKAELPKELDGDPGDENREATAALIHALGPLFEVDAADAIEFVNGYDDVPNVPPRGPARTRRGK